jgi:hypothetical protein
MGFFGLVVVVEAKLREHSRIFEKNNIHLLFCCCRTECLFDRAMPELGDAI